MTEEEIKEIVTPVAVCPICHKQLNICELHQTYKQDWLLRHELFRKLVYECKYCGCELKEQDFIRESVKEVEKMGIKNLTEAEEKEFYRLVKKMNEKELDKKQDAKVKKPIYGQEYFFSNSHGWVECDTWRDRAVDNKRWELGNAFLIREKALFDVEKRKVEVELERYAKEHNGPIRSDSFYLLYNNKDDGKLDYDVWSVCKPQGGVQFASKQLVFDAIEAVGKERILKYIFGVESEGEE